MEGRGEEMEREKVTHFSKCVCDSLVGMFSNLS